MSKKNQTTQNGHNENHSQDINVLNYDEFCDENNEKKLYLLQLPKELKKLKNLELDFNEITDNSIIEINNNKYLVNVIKTKVDFNCLIATDSANTEYTAINNFKAILRFRRHIEIEQAKAPDVNVKQQVKEPEYVDKYVKHREKTLKRKLKHQNKHAEKSFNSNSFVNQLYPEVKIKVEKDDEPKSKKHKKK